MTVDLTDYKDHANITRCQPFTQTVGVEVEGFYHWYLTLEGWETSTVIWKEQHDRLYPPVSAAGGGFLAGATGRHLWRGGER